MHVIAPIHELLAAHVKVTAPPKEPTIQETAQVEPTAVLMQSDSVHKGRLGIIDGQATRSANEARNQRPIEKDGVVEAVKIVTKIIRQKYPLSKP